MMASLVNWFKALFSPRLPQEAEAAAMVRFRDNDTAENILGFIVKNNIDLTGLIDPRHSYLEKYKNTKYFVYIPSATVPQCAPNDSAEIKVLVSRASQSEKDYLYCEVSALEGDDTVARVGAHLFIPCESVSFNRNSFLSKYSKTVMKSKNLLPVNPTSRESNEARLYGLKNNGEVIDITLVQLRRSDSSVLEVDDNVFDKLIDGPLLNESKTKLVGCLQKDQRKGQLRLDFFGMEDSVHAWKASTLQSRVTESDDSVTSADQCSKHDNNGGNSSAIVAAGVNSKIDNSFAVEVNLESSGNVIQPFNLANISSDKDGSLGIIGQGENGPSVGPEDIDERTTSNGSSSWAPEDSADGIALADAGGELDRTGNGQPNPSSSHESPHDYESLHFEDHDNNGEEEDARSDAVADNGGEESGSSNGELAIDDHQLDDVHDYKDMNAHDYHEPIQVSKERSPVSEHLPIEEQATDGEKHPNTEKLRKVTFCEMYDYDSSVVQDLGKIFDKRNATRKDISSVADKLNAHPLIKDKCKSNYSHSPASEVLDLPDVAMNPIETLVSHLKNGQKGTLASMIEEKLKADQKANYHIKTIEEFFNKHFELKEKITSKLEGCDDSFDWRWLAKSFSVDSTVLEQIERGTDPAENFLREYAYRCLPRKKLQLGMFYEHMKTLRRGNEMLILFQKHGIKVNQDDFYTKSLKDEYKPNTDRMDDLCKLLNKNNCKGWQCLAVLWGVKELDYFYYIPDTKASATKILFDWLMMQRPRFTVDSLRKIFQDLERTDATKVLGEKLAQYYEYRQKNKETEDKKMKSSV